MVGLFLICITALILYLISAQLTLTMKLNCNIYPNDNSLAILFFGISIVRWKISIISYDYKTMLVKIKINRHIVKLSLNPKSKEDSVFNYIAQPIFYIIDFIFFDIKFHFGYKNNALATVMVVQSVQMFILSITSIIKSSQHLDVHANFIPEFTEDKLAFEFTGIISASIANIIFSVISASRIKRQIAGKRRMAK